jgi:hypothetical protein
MALWHLCTHAVTEDGPDAGTVTRAGWGHMSKTAGNRFMRGAGLGVESAGAGAAFDASDETDICYTEKVAISRNPLEYDLLQPLIH